MDYTLSKLINKCKVDISIGHGHCNRLVKCIIDIKYESWVLKWNNEYNWEETQPQ